MIPLKDDIRHNSFPLINVFLIAVNMLFFIFELLLGPELNNYIYTHAVVPAQFLAADLTLEQLVRLTTTMFLHGGWLHLLSNMLYLWIFGDNVEDRMGHLRYLLFYLICGYIATLSHILMDPSSTIPLVGASGAIAGVLGAYLILFPRANVLTLVFVIIFIQVIHIPAVIFLGLWFLLQLLNVTAFSGQGAESVAFWAHIGGFIAGVVLVKLFARNRVKYY